MFVEEDLFKAFFNGQEVDTKVYPDYKQESEEAQQHKDQSSDKTIDL